VVQELAERGLLQPRLVEPRGDGTVERQLAAICQPAEEDGMNVFMRL